MTTYKIAEMFIKGDGEFAALDAEKYFGVDTLFHLAMKNDDTYEHDAKVDEECVDFSANITWYEMSSKQDAENMMEMHNELDQRQDDDSTKAQNSYCFLCEFVNDILVNYKPKYES